MVLGKVKKLFKKALTITLAAAMVATSVPQLSVEASAQEITLDAEGEEGSDGEDVSGGDESGSGDNGEGESGSGESGEGESGSGDSGEGESGSDDSGEGESGSDDNGEGESGSDDNGEGESGSGESGEGESGSDDNGESGSGDNDEGDNTKNMALRYVLSTVEKWTDLFQTDVAITGVTEFNKDYKISYDLYIPSDAEFEGSFYIKAVTKRGKNWKWTESGDAVTVERKDFVKSEENSSLAKYTYTGIIGELTFEEDEAVVDDSFEAVVVAVGSNAHDYNGAMFVDNVKVLDADGNVVATQDFNSDYENTVELGNMDGVSTGGEGNGDNNESTTNLALRYVLSAVEKWTDLFQTDVAITGVTEFNKNYKISYDLYIPSDAEFEGSFYIKAVTKRGKNWKWTESGDAVTVERKDFVKSEENSSLAKYTYTGTIGELTFEEDEEVVDDSFEAVVVAVGSNAHDYNGAMFVDNVKVLDADGNVVVTQDFNNNYEGAVELGNMDGVTTGGGTQTVSNVIFENNFDETTTDSFKDNIDKGKEKYQSYELAYLNEASGNKAVKFNSVDLTGTKEWTDVFKVACYLTEVYSNEDKTTDKLVLEYDVYFPESSIGTEGIGTIKAQGAVHANNWVWASQQSWPPYTDENLESDEGVDGFKKLHISIDLNNFVEYGSGKNASWTFDDITSVESVIPCLAGEKTNYSGDIYLDNVKVTAYTKIELPGVEGDVALSLDAANWTLSTDDYQYKGSKSIENTTIDEKQYLKASFDYSADSSYDWSEAKFDYKHPVTVESMYGYNAFKADIYYKPENMTSGKFKVKVFCKSLGMTESYIDLEKGEAVTDIAGLEGWYKTELNLPFITKDAEFSELTFGLIGVNTDYKGDVLFDNMRFTQVTADDIYVDATEVAKKGAGLTISEDGRTLTTESGNTVEIATEVALVDADAIDATKNTYAYLKAVGESDSVIFGHQNDTHKKAGATGDGFTNSDTKDVTGSIAGVLGIDTLSLTGNEASEWSTPEAERIANAVAITKAAADEGAIITLSAHMPNFDLIDQRVKTFEANGKTGDSSDTVGYWEAADGTKQYNFSGYTPGTVTGDVVNRIMPGNDLNYLFTDYLDLIADYAKELEKEGVTVLFRPFHENTGSWFWWGAAQCDEQAYINLYRYTVDYLKETKGVHNFIYVYGPGSEAENAEAYAARYPGDDYVDMIGYDMYHSTPTAENEATYLANIKKQNAILKEFATEHNKIYAITETGVANDGAALLPSGNEVKDWYMQLLNQICEDGGVSYVLVWANFNNTDSFYLPFVTEKKVDEEGNTILHGHEMLDEFIKFYNDNRSVFASDMNNGYKKITGVTNTTKDTKKVAGYFVVPVSGDRILDTTTFKAKITGVDETAKVSVVIETDVDGVILDAVYNAEQGVWEAVLSANELESLGEGTGTIILVVEGVEVARMNALMNMPEKEKDPLVADDFEDYNGNDALLASAWATNKESGSSINISLTDDADKVFGGTYALQMDITLASSTSYAGATKNLDCDWSAGNALELYTTPEGFNQKVVVQVESAGNVFEVYLQEYAVYTECGAAGVPVKVTIPFEAFVGRDNKDAKFNPAKIDKIGLWCNYVANENAALPLNTTITYDEIRVVTTDKTIVTMEALKAIPKEGIWVEEIPAQTYTGKALKPAVNVYDGEKLLTLNKDYSVKYENNKNVTDAAKVTIKGKGNYTSDAITKTFEIVAKDVNELTVTAPELIAYKEKNGAAVEQKLKTTVKNGKTTLKESRDYTKKITFNGEEVTMAKEAGVYTITIEGIGNYTGTLNVNCVVEKRTLLTNAKINLPSSSLDYNKEGATFNADDVKVTVKGKEVPKTTEAGKANYTISYRNNTSAGKNAYIVVTATADGDYAGSVEKKFTIKGEKFSAGTIQIEGFDSERDYTGKNQYQNLKVYNKAALRAAGDDTAKIQEAKLAKNVDYKISYKNNLNAGKATVVIEGCGKYTGKITKTFKIKAVTLTADMIKAQDIVVEQNKAGVTPDVSISYNGKKLVNGKDYTLSYKNNKNVTTEDKKATITIKGKGNYTGKLTDAVSFTIEAKALNSEDIAITVADIKYNKKKAEYKPSVVVTDNGKKLKVNKDYTVEYVNNTVEVAEGTEFAYQIASVVVRAVENGDYSESATVEFRITANMIKDVKVDVSNAQIYAKEGVTPTKEDLVVTYKNNPVDLTKYDIVSYAKNDQKGTATLVIKGNEEFGGTKTVKFKIEARSFAEKLTDAAASFFEALGF